MKEEAKKRPKGNTTPKNVKTRKEIVQPPSVLRMSKSPYLGMRALNSEFINADKTFFVDPNIRASRPQALYKVDRVSLRIDAEQCGDDKSFALGNSTSYAQGKRLVWLPPMNVHWNANGNTPARNEGDARGTFVDIGKTSISIRNLLYQDIRIVMNSPRGRINDTTNPYVRRYKKEVVIPGRKSRSFRFAWGDHANIYTPMQQNLSSDNSNKYPLPAFVLCDFMVVLPEANLMGGGLIDTQLKDTTVVELKVEQIYCSTAQYAGVLDIAQRPAFAVVKNPTTEGMLNEATVDMTNMSLTRNIRIHAQASMEVLKCGDELMTTPFPEGTLFVIDGVVGYFRQTSQGCVMWDPEAKVPLVSFDTGNRMIPAGATARVLQTAVHIKADSIIGFLTTLTEVIRIVSLIF